MRRRLILARKDDAVPHSKMRQCLVPTRKCEASPRSHVGRRTVLPNSGRFAY
ncbi:hypothetical protein GW17_00052487, partial [Ensete ventricosum]